jgi:outer membrane protein TolC
VKKHFFQIFFIGLSMVFTPCGQAQTRTLQLTLEEVIQLAQEQSLMAITARHRYMGSYWQFRAYRARFLPSLSLSGDLPDFSRSIQANIQDDGSTRFVERKNASYSLDASLTQNIGLTGGSIFMSSNLARSDNLEAGETQHLSTPVSIGLRQPIMGFNSFRWEKRIEPLRYESAQKNYIETMENVNQRAVMNFFNLAVAQVNLDIAELNYSNTDTLYNIGKGRYNIGTIAENELLEMELSFLNAGTALNEARTELEINKFRLRSFLGYNETVDIELVIPTEIPTLEVDVATALEQARINSPTMLDLRQQLLEAERSVAQARAERGLTATLFASYGLTQRADYFADVYSNPQDQQMLNVGLELPIVDWGERKGEYRMAQSNQDVTRTEVQQSEIDFDQEVMLQVMQFNLQDDQLLIAAKADTIAALRYDVTKQRFYIGRINVLELNLAQQDKDNAARGYLNALRDYWDYYYAIRRLTLYDFEKGVALTEDFDDLIE